MRRLGFIAALLWCSGALAQSEDVEQAVEPSDNEEVQGDEVDVEDEPAQEEEAIPNQEAAPAAGDERTRKADTDFDDIMQQRNLNIPQANRAGAMGYIGAQGGGESKVEVPLDQFERTRTQLKRVHEDKAKPLGPPVVLGAAAYRGEVRQGALFLTMTLEASLGWPGRFKMVPLIGDDVVVVRASEGKNALPLSRQNGYHVWVTERTGQVTLRLELLVPARGPRGSIEFDFLVARTPVTSFACRFPRAGLEPRITTAVHSQVRSAGGATTLEAALAPTTRLHLVGFRDLGDAEGRKAKIYAETMNLLSVDRGAADVFAVVRYTILYGGVREFQLRIPDNTKVVSADGEGAFRYELVKNAQGTLLKGETAYPIRNNYEISLRLHREIGKDKESFDAPLPRTVGVEREHGWLAVEVTGKLKLEEEARSEALAVDVRQLPSDMLESAVSPILLAYTYHSPAARVRLAMTRLPEKEPLSASIDRVRAMSVLSPDGKLLTDVRITLRNRLRPSLTMTLPAGSEVRSTLLDGEPVKPSRTDAGALILPLKRSAGDEQLQPFTLQVVLEDAQPALGYLGRPVVDLPALDLPVSTLAWTLFVPARNIYFWMRGDIAPQTLVGTAGWHQARTEHLAAAGHASGGGEAAASSGGGEMPVRIKIPESGVRLEYARYWIDADHPIAVSFWFLRGWLTRPLGLLSLLLLAWGIVLAAARWTPDARLRPGLVGLGLALLAAWPLYQLGGKGGVFLAVLAGAAVAGWRHGWLRHTWFDAREHFLTLAQRFRERPKTKLSPKGWLWRITLGGAFALVALLFFISLVRLVVLIWQPLSG